MSQSYDIRYLKRENIDTNRWDRCIVEATNGLIYAHSFYLDHMARHWDALVLNDYEAVMPLTWNKKLGIKYVYQPPFSQQLGIFSNRKIDELLMSSFIGITQEKFRFAEIFFNAKNQFIRFEQKSNYILDLKDNYESVSAFYKKDMLKNLKHSKKYDLLYSISDAFEEAVRLFIKQYRKRIPHVGADDYCRFMELCRIAFEKKMLLVRKTTTSSNELLSIAIFFIDNKRLYNVMSTTLPKGRDIGANHFLYDELIREFSGKNIILDFEGSEIPGIASFYQKFGALNEPYYFFRYNNLPWPLKFLK
ncbi:MAG TPA: GNAT family N-acetyltransferase [Puia sp.]|nr:GNAT family N-acetyltransferase [Puia sp.]